MIFFERNHTLPSYQPMIQKRIKLTIQNNFFPLNKTQQNKIRDVTTLRQELHAALKNEIPDSCCSLNVDKRRINNISIDHSTPLPPTPKEVAKRVPTDFSAEDKRAFIINELSGSEA